MTRSEAVDRLVRRGRKRDVRTGANQCRRCGCTDNFACPGGCTWANAERDLCSECAPPCPHCSSADMDYGFTGLDECRICGGFSRDGELLHRGEPESATRRTW